MPTAFVWTVLWWALCFITKNACIMWKFTSGYQFKFVFLDSSLSSTSNQRCIIKHLCWSLFILWWKEDNLISHLFKSSSISIRMSSATWREGLSRKTTLNNWVLQRPISSLAGSTDRFMFSSWVSSSDSRCSSVWFVSFPQQAAYNNKVKISWSI